MPNFFFRSLSEERQGKHKGELLIRKGRGTMVLLRTAMDWKLLSQNPITTWKRSLALYRKEERIYHVYIATVFTSYSELWLNCRCFIQSGYYLLQEACIEALTFWAIYQFQEWFLSQTLLVHIGLYLQFLDSLAVNKKLHKSLVW